MSLPKRDEVLRILRRSGCSKGVVCHCERVTEVALRIAHDLVRVGYDIDVDLVEAGALLHDLGRSKTHDIWHAVAGGEIAKSLGLTDDLVRIIERHIGAGLPEEEAVDLGLPRRCYIPTTLEEKIVAYADKLIEGAKEVEFEVTLEKFKEELGESHPALTRLKAMHEEMVELLKS